MKRRLLSYLVCSFGLCLQYGIAQETPLERGAFETRSAAGMRFRVLRLQPDGDYEGVGRPYAFVSGEKFRIEFELNTSGFAYVLNRTTPDESANDARGVRVGREQGKPPALTERPYRLIYPEPEKATVPIMHGRGRRLPLGDTEHFFIDENPGVESLVILVSPEPLNLEQAIAFVAGLHRSEVIDASPKDASEGDARAKNRANDALTADTANATVVDYPGTARGVGVTKAGSGYAIAKDSSKPFLVEITLLHSSRPAKP